MPEIFETSTINGMELANRLVRAATWSGLADESGNATEALVLKMAELAGGGVGLMITGHAFVHASGKHQPRQLGIDGDERIGGLRAVTSKVHEHGCKIAVQLGYGGAYLSKARVAQMNLGDFANLAAAYGLAAARAVQAGFDAVEILAAHGFFLSQLLCPRYNVRDDAYGGPIEHRARFLLEVLDAIRQAVPSDYPVLVKLNAHDGIDDGLSLAESMQVGGMLKAHGADAIEISGGLLNNPDALGKPGDDTAFFEQEARAFRQAVDIPLIVGGGIRSFDVAGRMVAEGITDYVAMCRPFICEPDLAARWQAGDTSQAECISCNNCVELIKEDKGLRCVPLAPAPAPNFFVQDSVAIPASPPHPDGAEYVVAFGLAESAGQFAPAVRVHLSLPGGDEELCPAFPLSADDHERVSQAISDLMAKHGGG